MPEEVLDTRKEKVKEVKEEKKDSPVQQLLKKVTEHKIFVSLKGAISKLKESKAKSNAKKEEAKASKEKASTAKEKK